MKSHKIVLFSLLVITLANFVSAGNSINYEAAMENYLKALNSNNDGMIESAIENLVKFKMAAPEVDFTEAGEKMESLCKTGKTNVICYKAFIGQLYLKNPERFNWLNSDSIETGYSKLDKMFAKIEVQLGN